MKVQKLRREWLVVCLLISVFGGFLLFSATAASKSARQFDGDQEMARLFKKHELLYLDKARIANDVKHGKQISIATSRGNVDIFLQPHDMRAQNFHAEETLDDGTLRSVSSGPVRTYRGRVHGLFEAEARFTVDKDTFEGVIITTDGLYFIEPAAKYTSSASESAFVLYEASDIKESSGTCGASLAEEVSAGKNLVPNLPLATSAPSQALSLDVDLATEADFEYVTAFGGSSGANSEILSIMNEVEGVYQSELGLTFSISVSAQHTWNTASDPYVSTNAPTMLGEFTNYWNANFTGIGRDVAHMWTGKDMDGSTIGIAFVGVICQDPSGSYGVSQKLSSTPGKFILTAHEIGHNFNAQHSNAVTECSNTIMQSSIGTGFTFCQFSRNEISAFTNANSSCLTTVATNVALSANGGVASAQNYTQDGVYPGLHFQPAYANDGTRFTSAGGDHYWRDEHGLPSWIQIDFNGPKTISEVDVFTVADNYQVQADPSLTQTFTNYGTTAFTVQYWTGSAWATIPGGSVTGNNLVWKKIAFSPLTTAKIRVAANAATDDVTRIAEVEAWGFASPAPTNVALSSNGCIATAQNYTQDSVYPGLHFQPAYANDGTRFTSFSGDHYWRDEHGLPSWVQFDFDGVKTITEVDVFTMADNYQLQSDPAPDQTFANYGVTAFEVQYWTGSAWATVPGGMVASNNLVKKKITFSGISTAKLRVIANAAIDGVSRIVEVEAWINTITVPPQTNVALIVNGGVATAQNYTQDGVYPGLHFQPAYANDGTHFTSVGGDHYWRDEHGLPSWIQIDFNGSKTISEVDVFTMADNYQVQADPGPTQTFANYGTTAFTVQYWTGSAWATIPGGSVTGNNLVWKKITFSALTTAKIRVTADAATDGVTRIAEVEAFTTGP